MPRYPDKGTGGNSKEPRIVFEIEQVARIGKRNTMNEIKCPECGTVFQVDESGFADIVKQVRDGEFAKEIQRQVELLQADKNTDRHANNERQQPALRTPKSPPG